MSKHHKHAPKPTPAPAPVVAPSPVVETVVAPVVEEIVEPVVAPPAKVRVLSQRPGDLVIAEGILKFNDIMEVSQETAEMLVKIEPKFIRIL